MNAWTSRWFGSLMLKTGGALFLAAMVTRADDFASLCNDRAAIERVYYARRTGTKPPFEQVLPRAALEQLVRSDQHKQAVLRRVYGVEITPELVRDEIRRIDASTRAPEILDALKAALGDDPERFARTVARPIVVDRLLRERFENDAALHTAQREQAEKTRVELLAAKQAGAGVEELLSLMQDRHPSAVTSKEWELTPPPDDDFGTPAPDELEIKRRFGPEAKLLSAPATSGLDRKLYFEELPDALQRVLRAQLRKPLDVSAVIETPREFLLYLCRERTEARFKVALLSLPKPSLEDWLEQQVQARTAQDRIPPLPAVQ